MKTDTEVHLMLRERKNGKTLEQAAARANMSAPTARKYLRSAKLPSALKSSRTYRTHPNPFDVDWPWVEQHLTRDPALQAKTLFSLLLEQHPDRYTQGQLRTFQRHVASWRAIHGPEKDVIFEQIHQPGRLAQSDFTHMDDLGITLSGVPFPHLLFHLVLTYSNVEAVSLCFSESFEALAEGVEFCLWQLGGVPQQHRTDNLSAAVQTIEPDGTRHWFARYEHIKPVFDLYFSNLYSPFTYVTNSFLNFVQAIETYHRRVYGGKYQDNDTYHNGLYKALVNALPSDIAPDLRTSLIKGKLWYANEYSLRKRLNDLLMKIKDSLPILVIGDDTTRKLFVDKVVETRNYLTHYDETSEYKSDDALSLVTLETRLQLILEACLLREIGFADAKIQTMLSKSSAYYALQSTILW